MTTPKMEKAIKTTAKLYGMRDTCRAFFKEKWQSKMDEWLPLIKAVMKRNNCDEIQAAMIMCKELEGHEMAQMIIWGTVVEMIEPNVK